MRRAKRREETTKRILDAAMSLMATEGYEVFTIARLAKELDYAVGALYRYFKGKDAILAALQVRVVDQISEDLTAVGQLVDDAAEAGSWDAQRKALTHVLAGIGVYESLSVRRPTHHRLLTLSLGGSARASRCRAGRRRRVALVAQGPRRRRRTHRRRRR